jgi:two-component system phosphate regulon response regulator PhoB
MSSKIRLLYAEDDPDTREMICFALESEGFEVVCPDNPREFLQLAKDKQWDALMMDTWMPDLSGVELCKSVREFDPHTPIVFYTAAAYERDKKQALECGAQAYIIKPVSFEVLIAGIRAAVNFPQSAARTGSGL